MATRRTFLHNAAAVGAGIMLAQAQTVRAAEDAGYTDKLPVDSLKQYEQDLYRYIDEKHPELWTDLKAKKELTDEIKKTLDKALKSFGKKFAAGSEEE